MSRLQKRYRRSPYYQKYVLDRQQDIREDTISTRLRQEPSKAGGAAGKRSALEHARVMIHQPSGGAQGQSRDIEITAREIVKIRQELYEILSKHSGKSFEDIERDSDRDYWMKAAEAKEYGLIDEILTRKV